MSNLKQSEHESEGNNNIPVDRSHSQLLSESLLKLSLISQNEVPDDIVYAAVGHRKASLYKKWLQRVNLPKKAVKHLPQVETTSNIALGCNSQKLFNEVYNRIHVDTAKENFSASEGENENENEESDDEESDNESSSEESGSSEETASETSEDESPVEPVHVHKLNAVFGNESQMKPKDLMARNFVRDPSLYSSHPVPERFKLILQNEYEKIIPAMPGLAGLEKPITKSRGGIDFLNYHGRWEKANIHGYGGYVFADGGNYEGDWVENQPHGFGRSEFPDGSYYEGEWKQGKRHGKGKTLSPEGIEYQGEYVEGKRSGEGVIKFPKGATYTGEFLDGTFHGRGHIITKKGYQYIGMWQKGLISGRGVITLLDGTRIVRIWKPPNTLNAFIEQLAEEEKEKEAKKFALKQEIYRVVNRAELKRYVQNVRAQIQQEKEDKRRAEEEEMDRLRRERREQIKKAKEEAMRAAAGESSEHEDSNETTEGIEDSSLKEQDKIN